MTVDPMGLIVLAIIAMAACLLIIPFGLPGIWLMIGILTVATALDEVAWWVLIILIALGAVAELAEYVLVKRTAERYGASRKAFWGAIAGGFVGVLVGFPVAFVGPLIAGLIGTFLGAAAVALIETRELREARRIGWGALIGRVLAVGLKVGAGLAILLIGATSLLVR